MMHFFFYILALYGASVSASPVIGAQLGTPLYINHKAIKVSNSTTEGSKISSAPAEGSAHSLNGTSKWEKRSISAPASVIAGSFQDGSCYQGRPIADWSASLSTMSVTKCVKACDMMGKGYAGLVNGNQCYCGSNKPKTKSVAQSKCNIQCPGDSSQNCGGVTYMKTYTVQLTGASLSTFTCPALQNRVFNVKKDHATDADFANSMLHYHNMYRLKHYVMPLTYDNNLARISLQRAKICVFKHTANNEYGENIAMGGYTNPALYLDMMYKEVDLYDYNNPGFSEATGHFTQFVWKDTESVGCGWTYCANNAPTYPYMLFCEYNPPGNYIGASNFRTNVIPGDNDLSVCTAPGFTI